MTLKWSNGGYDQYPMLFLEGYMWVIDSSRTYQRMVLVRRTDLQCQELITKNHIIDIGEDYE